MPIFKYKAKKINGEQIEGEEQALNPKELAKNLKEKDYILISFEKQDEEGAGSIFDFSLFGRIGLKEKMTFAKNLGAMVGAGISIVKGLDVLKNQTKNKKFKEILQGLKESILEGKPLADSMEKYPKVFSPLFRAMVRAGEVSGKLEESLNLLAFQLEQDYELKRKIRGAMIYPAVIIVAMIGIGILMLIYVVPTLTSTFAELNVDLPPTTLIVIGLSNFMINNVLAILLIFIAFVLLVGFYFRRSSSGKTAMALILLKVPVISTLVKEVNAARTSRTLSSLISSGVNVLQALEITEEVLQNPFYKKVLREAKEDIQKGKQISATFIRHSDIYPLVMGEMAAVGEETGRLSEMLLNIASFYEKEVAEKTKNLSSIIEPVLMIIIGSVVGFFAVSMIQPIYSMVGSL